MIHNIKNIGIIDQLIEKELGLAIFRLPGENEVSLILSSMDQIEQLSDFSLLNDTEGFVMAPFQCNAEHPVIVLRPDITMNGIRSVDEFLQSNAIEKWLSMPSAKMTESKSWCNTAEKKAYEESFNIFLNALIRKEADKLVLSRCHIEPNDEGITPGKTFLKACNRYPDAFVYLCYTPISGIWIGSSPEMLLSGTTPQFHTVALAGTKSLRRDGKSVRWDTKNRQEQQWVVTYLKQLFADLNIAWNENDTCSVKAGNVVHLKTTFDFIFDDPSQIGTLLKKLHPTPAVCGFPKDAAYQFILNHEGYDRTYYSGFIGILSSMKQTNLYVNLRCMKWTLSQRFLYAGGGLLDNSRLQNEWKETEAKLQTMLALLHPDNDWKE